MGALQPVGGGVVMPSSPSTKDAAHRFALALVPDVAVDAIRRTRLATTEQGNVRGEKIDGEVHPRARWAVSATEVLATEGTDYDTLEDQVTDLSNQYAPIGATFIVQTANATLTNEQALAALATGLVKVTTSTGVLSTAVAGTDYARVPLHASATLNFPSIGAANTADADQELTIPVTGAVAGNGVVLGPPAALEAGLSATGYVSAADTVTVRLANHTNAAIDPASATWHAFVMQP